MDVFKRFAKFSLIGFFGMALTSYTLFEGAHMWVENMELAPDKDHETAIWEWDQEAEKWSGGYNGGTDYGLGFKGRHAVRSAWIAQNWGTGSGASVIGSNAFNGQGPTGAGGLNVVDARLEYAQEFLSIAIAIAENRISTEKLRPEALVELLVRHADVLERMGSKIALFECRSQYERAWAGLPGSGIDTTRTAMKLGDINHRLGDSNDALTWWARTIQLTQTDNGTQRSPIPVVPEVAPSSALAQRTLVSTLVSLSAFYATSGQLREAQTVEEASLDLLRSIPLPSSLSKVSPPHTLHALYLLHRSSLISIHLAEVLFAQRKPVNNSIGRLSSAAEAAERVALTLTGLPGIAPDSGIHHPPASETPLLAVYSKSKVMKKPAQSLLRDARRTAAEAWSLMGILTEKVEGSKSEKALECYERALGWAGVATDSLGGPGQAGEGILESEWRALWGNYIRARDTMASRP
jgi:tetratricopeptide (TPR) repeat protein